MNSNVPQVRTEDEVREWLVEKLTTQMNIEREGLRLDEPLVAHGIDSMHFLALVGELEEWLGCRFADNPLIDYPSINALSGFLARQLMRGKKIIDPTDP